MASFKGTRTWMALAGLAGAVILMPCAFCRPEALPAEGRLLSDLEMARLFGDAPDTLDAPADPCVNAGKCVDSFPGSYLTKNACLKCDNADENAQDARKYCCAKGNGTACNSNGGAAGCKGLWVYWTNTYVLNNDSCNTCSNLKTFWQTDKKACSWFNASGDNCP